MSERIEVGNLAVAKELFDFVNNEALPGTGVAENAFWQGVCALFADLTPKNQALLDKRDSLQQQMDDWHKARRGKAHDAAAYKAFLQDIGYWQPEPDDFAIQTQRVDEEIAHMAGPQLVVPASNARFALNAANARWGSLYDALYGTDVIGEEDGAEKGQDYNPVRGAKVVAFARKVLDEVAPLVQGSHADATAYSIHDGQLAVQLAAGNTTALKNPSQFSGFQGSISQPEALLLKHNGLHVEIRFDSKSAIGRQDLAGISDVLVEAALSTIVDFEDSVAAVDAHDKVQVYRNWLGLMKGDLAEVVEKNGRSFTRRLNPDRQYQRADGSVLSLRGRSLLFVRNVGHLMRTPAIVDKATAEELPEGILDALISSLCALHDLQGKGKYRNSREQSVYIVKPKMHGAEEVAFSVELFARVEALLGLPANTLKLGLMDEERRTSVNLKACIKEARERLVFINTGFLDRTGDEIHSSMQAGVMRRKGEMKNADWLAAYELQNVGIGLACGLSGHAGSDGCHAQGKNRPPEKRRQYRLGTVTHCGDAARIALPSGGRICRTEGSCHTAAYRTRTSAWHPAGAEKLYGRRNCQRAGQQCAKHPRLCGALGRARHRLFQGAGHYRCGADGRPRDAADFQPASGQLAAARRAGRSANP